MSPNSVYVTRAPEALDAWDAFDALRRSNAEERRLFEARFDGRRLVVQNGATGQSACRGIEQRDGDPDLLGPWRKYKSQWYFRPANSKAGRQMADELKALSLSPLKVPGMPSLVMVSEQSRMFQPGIRRDGDALWASWGCAHEYLEDGKQHRADRVDTSIWCRAKLSEYFALIERDEEQEGAA